MSQEPIAIIGLGCVLPDAPNVDAFWNNLKSGKSSIREVPRERWNPDLYWSEDRNAPDKTYAKIGAFVEDDAFDGIQYRMPPKVVEQVDPCQRWALSATRQALLDAGYATGIRGDTGKEFDRDRCAVIIGNAMGGETNKIATKRLFWPEAREAIALDPDFQTLTGDQQAAVLARAEERYKSTTVPITEDTMPGHLSNVIAGRVANTFDLGGKNFTTDAACASSLAALDAAMETLRSDDADLVIWGGTDRSMDVTPYIQFSKIGALSPDGSRPFDKDANGFVMGEGCAMFILKRLSDAERDGDTIYATVIGLGGSSDGKGKGITAPNPAGQVKAVRRAYQDAGIDPATIGYLEAHGTSTPVGDPVELQSVEAAFQELAKIPAAQGSVRVGSVKSNIGHLKAGAGAAGMLKAALSIHHRELPPSINVKELNPRIDWGNSPFRVNTESTAWSDDVRRAAVSSFGFGGTNFHVVLENHRPGAYAKPATQTTTQSNATELDVAAFRTHMEGAAAFEPEAVVLAASEAPQAAGLFAPSFAETSEGPRLRDLLRPFTERGVDASQRVAFHVESVDDIPKKLATAQKAASNPAAAKLAYNQGIFIGEGKPEGKVAFLFPGQGTQYVNMGRDLAQKYEVVRSTFAEADAALYDELGGVKLTDILWPTPDTPENRKASEDKLRLTEFTQPAVLAMDAAILRLLTQWGIKPDVVAGHSLGEYGALVAAEVMTLNDALHAVAARGREMANVDLPDLGKMVSVSADWQAVQGAIEGVEGYVICANKNCPSQTVIAGSTEGVDNAVVKLKEAGLTTMELPVSAAFHSEIVAPASQPLRKVLARLGVQAPKVRVLSNVGAQPYQDDPEWILDNLAIQVASPVAWTDIVERMYDEGVRTFIEVGPKRALTGFVADILQDKTDIRPIFANHPKQGGIASINTLYAFLGANGFQPTVPTLADPALYTPEFRDPAAKFQRATTLAEPVATTRSTPAGGPLDAIKAKLDAIQNEVAQLQANPAAPAAPTTIGISGISVGLPGKNKPFFAEDNWDRILRGDNLIDALDEDARQAMVDKHITRLVKSAGGQGTFERIDDPGQVIKLAGQRGSFDLHEWGIADELVDVLDVTSQYAIAAGLEALRDAGIPLQRTYKETSTGSKLPQGWALPQSVGDETGVIFASAFPGYDALLQNIASEGPDAVFNRKFLFHVLSMGHSQVAQFLGARGPNTQVNAACASTTQAIAIAEDWIRAGRCKRVLVLGADDATSPQLMEWIGSGFLASGAATTEADVTKAALPFDARRHGMIIGMGAVGLVIEAESESTTRGMKPIARLLGSEVCNSAFHGSRLDIDHIAGTMQRLVAKSGMSPDAIAPATVFMSHETYTPARGGSAAAEIHALRGTFGAAANQVVVANTKGFTGHPQGAGIEDAVVLKCLQRGVVPPIPHLQQPDPALGDLLLSKGGQYPVRYALRLAAGFGSQVAMTLTELVAREDERIANQGQYDQWVAQVTGIPGATLEVQNRTLRVVDAAAPVAPAAAPAPSPEPVPVVVTPDGESLERVTAVVAEKTGYPLELLEPDLDLEADLGIDTVKQAELFGELRETFGVALDESLQLSEYNTLRKVATYMGGGTPPAATPVAAPTPLAADAPKAPPAPTAPVAVANDVALATVTTVVADKTGYPAELLEADLDLEADLGIDTVKQAELFGALREMFGVPLDESLQLSDYNTLRKVAAYMGGDASNPTQPPTQEATAPSGGALEKVTAVVAEKTGYPVELLEADLDLEADLGIDTVKQAELFGELRQNFGVPLDESLQLSEYNTLRKVADYMGAGNSPAPSQVEPPAQAASEPAAASAIRRLIPSLRPQASPDVDNGLGSEGIVLMRGQSAHPSFADALQAAGFIAKQELAEGQTVKGIVFTVTRPDEEDPDIWAGQLFDVAKEFQTHLGPNTFFAVVTAQDGAHGLNDPRDGGMAAIAGFAKALRKELPGCIVKAIDIHPGDKRAAGRVVHEILHGGTRTEICFGEDGTRYVVDVAPQEVAMGIPSVAGKTLVVPGGAQGITAAMLQELASQGPNLVLMGRTELPEESATWAAWTDDQWKAAETAAIEDLKSAGQKATPVTVKKRVDPMRKAADMHRSIEALEQAGAHVMYDAVDVTDAAGVKALVDSARAHFGSIDGIIHAAGVEISKMLVDKPREQFELVFGIKYLGLEALLAATRDDELEFLVAFGSVAGRFGNIGQVDYSAVNELLAKEVKRHAALRNIPTAFTIAWGPWGEVGMATRGGIMTVLEQSGVTPIPTETGVNMFLAEMATPGIRECVVAGNLGDLDIDGQIVSQPWDPAISEAESWLQTAPERFRLLESIEAFSPGKSVTATVRLDRQRDAYLMDHAIDGTPLLPGVFGVEAFAEAGRLLADEDLHFHGAKDIRFSAPLKQHKDTPVHATLTAGVVAVRDEETQIKCTLSTQFMGPDGKPHGEPRVHFEGTVRFGPPLETLRTGDVPVCNDDVGKEAIYPPFFHGPRFQVLASAGPLGDESIGMWTAPPADAFAAGDARFLSHPMVTEGLFQLCGLRTMHTDGAMSLPAGIERLDILPGRLGAELRLWCRYTGTENGLRRFDGAACTPDGTVVLRFTGYDMIETGPIEIVTASPATRESSAPAESAPTPSESLPLPTIDGVEFRSTPVQETDADPNWFTQEERAKHASFAAPKRASEWLAARRAIKELVTSQVASLSPHDITVKTLESGQPQLMVKGQASPATISITHRDGMAIVAVAMEPVGIDLETIEDRPDAWWDQAFSGPEKERLRAAADPSQAASCAWAAKEACLKRHGRGLDVPLHRIIVQPSEAGVTVDGPFGTFGVRFFDVAGRVLAVSTGRMDPATATTE